MLVDQFGSEAVRDKLCPISCIASNAVVSASRSVGNLAFKEAFKLSERYIFDSEMPGRAVRLLEMAAGFADNKIGHIAHI